MPLGPAVARATMTERKLIYVFEEPVTEESVAGLSASEKQELYSKRREIWYEANVRPYLPPDQQKKGRPR